LAVISIVRAPAVAVEPLALVASVELVELVAELESGCDVVAGPF
jgi:hypothetical protein